MEHGFPARLVVPGYCGTNHVKWICRLELADRRPEGVFTTQLYFDGPEGSERKPVWEADPDAIFVFLHGATIGVPVTSCGGVHGGTAKWFSRKSAWMAATVGSRRVCARELVADGGPSNFTGSRAHLETIASCAARPDATGRTQPMSGWRNEVHSLEVAVN